MSTTTLTSPFRLENPFRDPLRRALMGAVRPALERALFFPTLNGLYSDLARRADERHFSEKALATLDITIDATEDNVARIPREGPLVVVANHPFGGLDGLALLALLRRVRLDVKLLGNAMLRAVPDLQDALLYVDAFGGPGAERRNLAPVRTALRWVRDGGALAIFPAGEVSHISLASRAVTDPPWSLAAGALVLRTGAPVLPVRFEGRNSALFQVAGLAHPLLRTLLLPRELLRRRRSAVTVRVGTPIPHARLAGLDSVEQMTEYLRVRTEILAGRRDSPARQSPRSRASTSASAGEGPRIATLPMRRSGARPSVVAQVPAGSAWGDHAWRSPTATGIVRPWVSRVRAHLGFGERIRADRAGEVPEPACTGAGERAGVGALAPIAPAVPAEHLRREIASLPPEQRLVESGHYDVLYARAIQCPAVLREIGRLRETAFRLAGEGTGKASDLDRFDEHYLHLFAWNRETGEIVGAYRMGPTDEILPRFGRDGLYTSTLFRYRKPLLEQIGPALELGRSFVRPEYQKTHSALGLLWKGIGRYVADHPRYRRLFGPVSISNEYQSMTRQILMVFLTVNRSLSGLGRLIRPRNPARRGPLPDRMAHAASTVVRDLDEVEDLVREIEEDRRTIPVLLRQYLKLNGVLLGFNVDPDFGDVLDGLMLADLTQVSRAVLVRYMGREGAASFLAHHDQGLEERPRRVRPA